MPTIKLSHVVSFSSEDPVHPASNLILPSGDKKFRCSTPGENALSAVVQLERSTCISQIDLGNDGSAFIEVQVGRQEEGEKFKTILTSSSFMSPMEARNEKMQNRVRFFTGNDLNQDLLTERWDRIKIICTQPFNKHVKYGIAFLTLTSPSEGQKEEKVKGTKLGAFTVKEEDDSDPPTVGNLFSRKLKPNTDSPKGGSSSQAAEIKSKETLATMALKGSNSEENGRPMFYQLKKLEDKKRDSNTSKRNDTKKLPPRNVLPGEDERETKTPKRKRDTNDGTSSSAAKKPKVDGKPFKKLMDGVVFTISGIQNPTRGQIRQMALEMGAKYKPDWDGSCTHLICAFANTPKFNQVKGKGKIVTKDWIEKCHRDKKRFPWRRFALDSKDKKKDESEDEIWDEKLIPKPETKETPKKKQTEPDDYEMDTDDEIEAMNKENEENDEKPKANDGDDDDDDDAYDAETDVDDDDNELSQSIVDLDFPELPDFFHKKVFFLYGSFSDLKRKHIKRCIIAAGGQESQYMNSKVDLIITDEKWNKDFDGALKDHPKVKFVTSDYVDGCWKEQKYLNYADFRVKKR